MKIAIIGSGNVGSALGQGWIKAGHEVVFGVRDPTSAKTQKAGQRISGVQIMTLPDASRYAEVIVLTTPPEAILEILPQLGDVNNKVIIDTTNSVRTKPEPYPTAFHAIQALTKSVHLVKCFNSTGFENMLNPVYRGESLDMLAAGSDPKAKQTAVQLAKDLGFASCYDFGGDDKVELLEKFALSWINLAIMQGHGRDIAFKIIRR